MRGRRMLPVPRRVSVAAALALAAGVLAGCVAALPAPAPRWAEPAPTPPKNPASVGYADLADPAWVSAVSEATGIPARQLAAYAAAAIVKHDTMPECVFSWTTLAAIGWIESDHGRHDGSEVDADGRVSPPIYGVALDGDGVALIPDSDGGEIDADAHLDRAVGPFQMIPQSWRNWHIDIDGDGVADPQDIDDASMAATNYLCRASKPQDTEEGWRAAVEAYNSATTYVGEVAARAVAYGEAAQSVVGASVTPAAG
ncbi:MAG: lytic murein transglycosylase [Actinomycetales bacterium]|nr:lytic murein transglycosylase [Actinomycetales bacterium]